MTAAPPLRIAMAVRIFPVLTETFILEPIVHLIEQGHQVDIIALYRGDPADAHPAVHEYGLEDRAIFLIDDRAGRGPLRKAWTGVKRLLRTPTALPWRRVVADVAKRAVMKLSPELVLAALGATTARPRESPSYDVIHAHFGPVGLVMQHLRDWGLLEGPLMVTFHGSDVLVEPKRHPPGFYDRLFAGAETLTTNTRFLRDELRSLGAPGEKCVVVPVGVDPAAIEFRPRRLAPGEPFRVLTVATLKPLKGLRYGIEAIHALQEEGIDVVYTIIGDGPARPELDSLIRRLGLENAVQLAGSLRWDRIPDAYAEHHVFVLPGVVDADGGREAQGRVLIEAQASGMPVVATTVGGMPEVVAPGAGRLVPDRDPAALAAALRRLRDESDEWAAMGRRGREAVERRFDSRRILEATVERYRALARGPDAAS